MLRKLTLAVVVAGLSASFALAQAPAVQPGGAKVQPTWGKITKYSDNKLYFQAYDPVTK